MDFTVWTKKNGEKVNIKDMDTDHIKNTIKMMERNKYVSADKYVKTFAISTLDLSDAAEMAIENEQLQMFGKKPSVWIDVLNDELNNRENH